MTAVYYTAKRSLIAGVNVDDAISFDLPFASFQRAPRPDNQVNTSQDGTRETLHYDTTIRWDWSTIPLSRTLAAGIPGMRQFLDSVDRGETFQIDIDGSVAVPVSPLRDMQLDEFGYTETGVGGPGLPFAAINGRFVQV